MYDPIKRAALIWYRAEVQAGNQPADRSDADVYALAIPRVRAVLGGEVRWSEAGRGDRVIWRGRARHVPWDGQGWAGWLNLYDFARLTSPKSDVRTFDEGALGHVCLKNHSLNDPRCGDPGHWHARLGSETCFEVQQLYCEASRDIDPDDSIIVHLHVGAMFHQSHQLRETILGVPVGTVIPCRQTFGVRFHGHHVTSPIDLTVHLEGTWWYVDEHGHRVGSSAHRAALSSG